METIIETKNLSRIYQTTVKPEGIKNSFAAFFKREYKNKVALNEVNLKIHRGQIIGLVGANGAGKTTLLKLLSGLIYPSHGEVQVLGFTPQKRQVAFLKRISILLGQKNQLWWDIPAIDSYSLLTTIYELDEKDSKKRVAELAEILNCTHVLETPLRRLSLGERMKMEIIGSLLHKPEVLFLDEPTIGLDVVAQNAIRDFLHEYVRQENPTVILTSHYMDDIAKLADRLLLVSQGALVYDGTVEGFTSKSTLNQKLICKFEQPMVRDLELFDTCKIAKGTSLFQGEVPADKVGAVLTQILAVAKIEKLNIEETDFEDVIREFLQKH
jgi:ABC-2 type transport system ATP-binding protein